MRITDLLKKECVLLNATPGTKDAAFDILIDLQVKSGNISDKEEYKKGILAREAQCTTAIGEGLAIPHAKNKAVVKPGLAAITVPSGVDCDSMDKAPTNLLFMIAAPETGGDVHLEVLANLNKMLMDPAFRKNLLAASTVEEFLKIIDEKEAATIGIVNIAGTQASAGGSKPADKGFRILAVTACPTGIAHTFMAAEALELKAKELGYTLKAETNGSGGAKNTLTKEEIEKADGIIIAADTNVEMSRFDGKKLIKVKVADGIHKPQELIEKIVKGDASVYHHTGAKAAESNQSDSVGHTLYKHLMSGISHMLPFVIGGGILIALAFMIDTFILGDAVVLKDLGSNTKLAALFMNIGKAAFGFMLPVLAGYIAMSIADRPGLAVGFVGGAIASSGMTLYAKEGIPSAFLGALVAGFAAGYIVLGLKKLFSKLPASIEGIKPILLYPLFGVFAIGLLMCAINPAMGALNTALSDTLNSMGSGSKVLLGLVVAGMMAIDMGGPFNKAAYVFGTASIASGNYEIMAAVMVGGMVPPIAIALSTTFFKSRWTPEERKSGFVNYIMGACFITEGAIPFAAANPLKIIPSCMIGSGVAGALSMLLGCTLMAPHGGIFVVGIMGNPFGYLFALLVGSVVGMLLITMLKKPIKEVN